MCFLDILPNTKENFTTIFKKQEIHVQFPITECIIVIGFILNLLLQQSLLTWEEWRDSHQQDDLEQNQGLLEECEMQDLSDEPSYLREDHEQSLVERFHSSSLHSSQHGEENDVNDDVISISNHTDHSHIHPRISFLTHRGSFLPFFIFIFAYGLHSIFEGITLGLQTSTSKAVHFFIVIIVHEGLLALAIGINASKLRHSFITHLKYALSFSAVIPVGIIIGIGIQHTPGTSGEATSAILQALTCGIFLHVIFGDFLPTEFSRGRDRILRVLFVVLGFIINAVVIFFLS
ncbi:zinc transporter ZIP3 [Caerostris darwini]|uniref:Zinc transporter ZIP3 n=1 Tax=Caerostris darwini TaxID=1538125 RepID=A0AAV4T7J5_9ARAC|nr:zinc transporter ZIP3 [Caerostris darwini]